MDTVFKKSLELATWTASMPELVVKKGQAVTTGDGNFYTALHPLRLMPFTRFCIHKQFDDSAGELRAFRRSILDFTADVHPMFKFIDLDTTVAHAWPVLFPGFDGLSDGVTVTLFEPEASVVLSTTQPEAASLS